MCPIEGANLIRRKWRDEAFAAYGIIIVCVIIIALIYMFRFFMAVAGLGKCVRQECTLDENMFRIVFSGSSMVAFAFSVMSAGMVWFMAYVHSGSYGLPIDHTIHRMKRNHRSFWVVPSIDFACLIAPLFLTEESCLIGHMVQAIGALINSEVLSCAITGKTLARLIFDRKNE